MSKCEFTKEVLEDHEFMMSLVDIGMKFEKVSEDEEAQTVTYDLTWDNNPFEDDDYITLVVDKKTKEVSAMKEELMDTIYYFD